MVCDTKPFRRGQSLEQRKAEVKKIVYDVNSLISTGKIKPVVDRKTGAVAFQGLDENLRGGVSDACIYRRLLVSGSSLAKAALQRAELVAGRSVDKQMLAQGVHSHDGGASWHHGH